MRRGREFIGVPVIDAVCKESLGEICDLVFSEDGKLIAFGVAPVKGLFRKARTVRVQAFESVSPEGAILRDRNVLAEDEEPVDGCRLLEKNGGLCGRSLRTGSGKELGVIGDVILESRPFQLWGFEVSDGILKDLLDGRPIVDATGATMWEEAVVLFDGAPGYTGDWTHMKLGETGHPTLEGGDEL